MVKHLSTRRTEPPSLVRFAPSGAKFLTAAAGQDKQFVLTLWDAEDPKPVAELPTPMSVVYGLNFSPEAHYAVAASYGEFLLWDLQKLSHRVVKSSLPGNAYGATFLPPDNSTLVVANMTKGLEYWDVTKDPPVARRIVSRDLWAWDLASSPDGKRLFAPCSGGLSVLSTYSGDCLAEFSGLTGPRQPGFAVHPDGNTVVWMTGPQLVTWQAPSFADIETIEKAEANIRKAQTAAMGLAMVRTREAGAIKKWLVLAPIPFAPESPGGVAALDLEQIPQEAGLRPRIGDRAKLGRGKLTWRATHLEDSIIDFGQLSRKQADFSVAYAVCYIHSQQDRKGLLMKIGSDDQAKVYLNGKEIYRQTASRAFVPDQDTVEQGVELKAGLNVMVFKVVNELEAWAGSVRLTDAAGQPVEGIEVSLEPVEARGH